MPPVAERAPPPAAPVFPAEPVVPLNVFDGQIPGLPPTSYGQVPQLPAPAGAQVSPLPIEVASQDLSWPSSTGCADAFQPCGGSSWQGVTCCKIGCNCVARGNFLSHCEPADPNARECAADFTPMFMKKNTGRGPISTRTMNETSRSRFVVLGAIASCATLSGFMLVVAATRTTLGRRFGAMLADGVNGRPIVWYEELEHGRSSRPLVLQHRDEREEEQQLAELVASPRLQVGFRSVGSP